MEDSHPHVALGTTNHHLGSNEGCNAGTLCTNLLQPRSLQEATTPQARNNDDALNMEGNHPHVALGVEEVHDQLALVELEVEVELDELVKER